MADKDKRIEFELPEEGSNRGSVFIPPLAMDSTLQALLKNNEKLKTNLDKYLMAVARKMQDGKKQSEALDDLIKTLEKKSKSTEKETEEAKESVENFSQSVEGASEGLEKLDKNFSESSDELREKTNKLGRTMVNLSKDFTWSLNAFDFVVKSLLSFGTITGGYLVASVKNTGEALNSLTDVGQAFGDVTGTGTRSTLENISAMGRLGLTVDQAAQVFQTFSRTAAILGQSQIPNLSKQFLELTNYGADFGVTLDDATQIFLEDQEFRSRILNRDQMMDQHHARRSVESIKQLRMFSTALGISTDELRQGAMGMLDSNQSIQSLIMNMGSRGPEVQAALTSLVAGLKGSGIDDEIISGILEVASVGATGASDFLNKLIPSNPEAYKALTQIGLDIRQGELNLADMPNLTNSILNTFSTIDKNGKLQALLASDVGGDLQGPTRALITSSRNAEAAAKSFANLAERAGVSDQLYNEVQTALNNAKNLFSKLVATTSVFQVSLVSNIGQGFTKFIKDEKKRNDVIKNFSLVVRNTGEAIGKVIGDFIQKIGGGGPNSLQNGITKLINRFGEIGERFTKFIEGVLDGFLDKNNNLDIMGGIANYIKESINFLMPIVLSALGNALWIGITTLFSKQGALLSGLLIGLFVGKAALRAVGIAIAGHWASSSATMTASQASWWTGFSTMMTTQFGVLMTRLNAMAMGGSFVGPLRPTGGGLSRGAGFLATAGSMVTKAAPYVGGAMVAKDAFDVVAGTDGGASGKNIGGTIGGAIGALGFLLGPLGGAIGMAAGNFIGNKIGGLFDKKDEESIKINPQNQPAGTIAVTGPDGNIQYVQTAQPQQQNSNRIKYHAIEDIANRAVVAGGMNSRDAHTLNALSDEAKLLTQILVENKEVYAILKQSKSVLQDVERNTKDLS